MPEVSDVQVALHIAEKKSRRTVKVCGSYFTILDRQ
jgi:hypothetical protein